MKLASLIVLLIVNALGAVAAAADLPAGGVVAAGTASFATGANSLQVNQGSNRAIINWNSFSVGAGNTVQFVQPSTSSAVLNRVVAANPSQIYGSISANGQVFLVNPNGIYVGPGGAIQAAGIFLSTGDISNADFLADNLRFEPAVAETPIVISGSLDAADRIEIRAWSLDCSTCTLTGQTLFVDAAAVMPSTAFTPLSITPPGLLAPLLPASLPELSSNSGGNFTIGTSTIALNGPSVSSGSLSLMVGSSPTPSGSAPLGGTVSLSAGSITTTEMSGSDPRNFTATTTLSGAFNGGTIGISNMGAKMSSLPSAPPILTTRIIDVGKLLRQVSGSMTLRGTSSIQPAAQSPPSPGSAATTPPPALRASAPTARLVNTGSLVDGAVTVRLSLVDAAPISLR